MPAKKKIDWDALIGQKVGRLKILSWGWRKDYRIAICSCDCGNSASPMWSNIKAGRTGSCGCREKEARITHGHAGCSAYQSWENMINRCNPETVQGILFSKYPKLGMFDGWRDFAQFYKDMGDRPDGTSLDRIDNNKGYFPSNCRWATKKQQQQNMSSNRWITYEDETKCLSEWSRNRGIPVTTLLNRLKRWPLAQALGFEPRVRNK